MHAQRIIQELLSRMCPAMHAKRRACVAKVVEAGRVGGLGLLKMSRVLASKTTIRHRIKCCDRLLSNSHLHREVKQIYSALCRSVLPQRGRVGIIVDWSDLLADGSAHLLRAGVIVKGRAFVLYEEVHPGEDYGSPTVHRNFLLTLRQLLPPNCQPVVITDAGFRATWFKLATELRYEWVGRIRNRDTVCADGSSVWAGCKQLYRYATGRARTLGTFIYTKANPIVCRLVAYKKPPQGRQRLTAFGKKAKSKVSKKNQASQKEPWLLAVSPGLAELSAKAIVSLYANRMQIEQTFRDAKNPHLGLGLTTSQTRNRQRLSILLLLGALVTYALWLIGLAAQQIGYNIGYGSKTKAANTLSTISLAQFWICEQKPRPLSRHAIADTLCTLADLVKKI